MFLVFSWFVLRLSLISCVFTMVFLFYLCKGSIAQKTLQISPEATNILPVSIFSLSTQDSVRQSVSFHAGRIGFFQGGLQASAFL